MLTEAQRIYDAALAGICPFDETKLELSLVREWAEECSSCGARFHARNGIVVVSMPKVGMDDQRDVEILFTDAGRKALEEASKAGGLG